MKPILNSPDLPYCRGCGHSLIAKGTAKALEALGIQPADVIIVTDIGCHGIIDRCLNTHTVHGLHGRSVALGAGIAMGLDNPDKEVIVFIGDGGSTIGLQHILEAARLNLDMTVVVHNNMLYGMTGGQSSGLTPRDFKTVFPESGNPYESYDLCALLVSQGAARVSRIAGTGDLSSHLQEALSVRGFSLIEVVEVCPGYGVKFNPGRNLREIIATSGKPAGKWENQRESFVYPRGTKTEDLLGDLRFIDQTNDPVAPFSLALVLSGSAGEGVQVAARLLACAAVGAGYHVALKGNYPVTVGVGFSSAELVISDRPAGSHDTEIPGVVVVTSGDGLSHIRKRIAGMKKGMLFIDSSLPVPETGSDIYSHDFRSAGARSASLYALLVFLKTTGYIPVEAVFRAIRDQGYDKKVQTGRLRSLIGC